MARPPASNLSTASRRPQALAWLMGRINYERSAGIPYHQRQLKLDRMRQLLTRLGSPDAGMKIVHVAGTKGKGSTSRLIGAALQAAGYRVGIYSSPHLWQIEERFAVDGRPCRDEQFVDLVGRLRPIVASMDQLGPVGVSGTDGPTYFEVTTAIALQHFADQQVDIAVLEVGLGGRLDATNVCLPVVSVISSISFDHTRQLGNSLASIAREKAGIIKPGVPVISGVREAEPREQIVAIAREHGCRVVEIGRDFDVTHEVNGLGGRIDFRRFGQEPIDQAIELMGLELALMGRHQAWNAATAIATLLELRHQGWSISESAIRHGLATVRLPARIEYIPGNPQVIIDAAHNGASAAALVEAVCQNFAGLRKVLILSISRDKDVPAILRQLTPHFDQFVVTEFQENPRAIPADELARMLGDHFHLVPGSPPEVVIIPQPEQAWQHAQQSARDGLAVIAGSFFIAAEMRPLMLQECAPA